MAEIIGYHCWICREHRDFVVLWGSTHAMLWDSSHAVLRGSTHAVLRGSTHAVLWDSSHAELWDSSHAVLRDSSHAVLRGSSHAVLRDSSHAVLRDSSHAVLWDSTHAVLWDSTHAEARSPYVTLRQFSSTATAFGGNIIGASPLSALEWLALCGVKITRGYVMLYKSLHPDFTSQNGFAYILGQRHDAPDWDASFAGECGKGVHYSPTVAQARQFRDEGCYIACRVAVADMAGLPAYAEYPDKIRAKGGVALYRVDADGKRLRGAAK